MYEISNSATVRMCAKRTIKPGKADRKIKKNDGMVLRDMRHKVKKKTELQIASMPFSLNTH